MNGCRKLTRNYKIDDVFSFNNQIVPIQE